MEINIRYPNLNDLDSVGVPKDFAQVRDIFNDYLDQNKLRYVPRRTPITNNEIKNKWVPSAGKNILLLAELKPLEKIVGSLTVLNIPDSNDYEYKKGRKKGDISEFAISYENFSEIHIKKMLLKSAIKELNEKNYSARFVAPVEDPFLSFLEAKGYNSKERFSVKRYKEIGLSGKAKEYFLP